VIGGVRVVAHRRTLDRAQLAHDFGFGFKPIRLTHIVVSFFHD
jgi:hypothetical protein